MSAGVIEALAGRSRGRLVNNSDALLRISTEGQHHDATDTRQHREREQPQRIAARGVLDNAKKVATQEPADVSDRVDLRYRRCGNASRHAFCRKRPEWPLDDVRGRDGDTQ